MLKELQIISEKHKIPLSYLKNISEFDLITIIHLSGFLKKGNLIDDVYWKQLYEKISQNFTINDQICFSNLTKNLITKWEVLLNPLRGTYKYWELEETFVGLKDLLIAKEYEPLVKKVLENTIPGSCIVCPWDCAPENLKNAFSQGGGENCIIIAPSKNWIFEKLVDCGGNIYTEFITPSKHVVWVIE